ncbi:LysR family transcriptional regulator [Shimia abyssi]|uniref:LysR family transcriptional regulator n=1 Tax=Shimia abyssi TaxID=1662395 RepID=A0A2P8FEJ2_9RHOB|nr:LysR family transcriptional regulator [Shimia abyssi]
MPPLDWLRIFEAAARLQGFSAAAREFGLTQAAVSQRIRNLESWLGRDLFVRSARGVTLTYAGEGYLPLVQDALSRLERGTEAMFGTAPRDMHISALSSHLDALVLPALPEFTYAHPNVQVVVDTVPQRSNFEQDRTALQLRFGRGDWARRKAALICKEELAPMAAGQDNREWPEIAGIKLRGERPGWRDWAAVTGYPAPAQDRLSVDSMQHALSAAAAGGGVALGSVALARPHLEAGRLRKLALPSLATEDGYWLTWPEDEFRAPKAQQMLADFTTALRGSVGTIE